MLRRLAVQPRTVFGDAPCLKLSVDGYTWRLKHYRQNGTLEYEIPFCNGETCGEQHNYDEQGNIVKITRFDANGDVESVQEISLGSQPHGTAKKSRRKS